MIDLLPQTGLPVSFNEETQRLVFRPPLGAPDIKTRGVSDLAKVWMEKPQEPDRELYYYTLNLNLPADAAVWRPANLMHGIVVIPPGRVGREFVKTSGQYHPPAGPGRPSYPEIYTVIKGAGHFLLQKSVPPYKAVTDLVAVETRVGEHFIVPPDYGHLQINPGEETLIFSYTMVAEMGASIYWPFQDNQGAGYYALAKTDGGAEWIANSHYTPLPRLRFVRAGALSPFAKEFSKEPPYRYVTAHAAEFKFLTEPELFRNEWRF